MQWSLIWCLASALVVSGDQGEQLTGQQNIYRPHYERTFSPSQLLSGEASAYYKQHSEGATREALDAQTFYAEYLADVWGDNPQERLKSWNLLQNAADQGHPSAQHQLAVAYATGLYAGNPIPTGSADVGLSLMYDFMSAQSGHVLANMAMGHRYLSGRDVPESCEAALDYYAFASNHVAETVDLRGYSIHVDRSRLSSMFTYTNARSGRRGKDVDEEVIEFYEQLAANGDVMAQLALGNLYLTGTNLVPQNPTLAVKYFEMAAEQGDVACSGQVGYMYARGIGVTRNETKALNYLTFAKARGDLQATWALGYCYWMGIGKPVNMSKAISLLSIAASEPHSHPSALYYLGEIHMGVGRERAQGTPEETGWDKVDIKPSISATLYTRAAHRNHLLALHKLGNMIHYGNGVTYACSGAVTAYRTVAERGDWAVGLSSAFNSFLKGSYRLSLSHYSHLAHLGYDSAQSNAGYILTQSYCGDGNSTLCEQIAFEFFRQSALQGDAEAYLKVGDYHYYGKAALPVDKAEAALYYKYAADMKNPHAMFNLGVMFEQGDGVDQDFHLAKRFFDQSGDFDQNSRTPSMLAVLMLQTHKILHLSLGPAHAEQLLAVVMRWLRVMYNFIVTYCAGPVASVLGSSPVTHAQTLPQVYTYEGASYLTHVLVWIRYLQHRMFGTAPLAPIQHPGVEGMGLDIGLGFDTVLILLLCAIFGILMTVRVRRGRNNDFR